MNARAQHGLDICWNKITDLIFFYKQVRCNDDWWVEVIDECRDGRMTKDTHAFLHGEPTSVPGSWLKANGAPTCGRGCSQMKKECSVCCHERKRRCRVYKGKQYDKGDARPQSKKFRHAVSVVPNNDLKMEICKHGAAQWARDHGQPILWCPADDRIASSCGLLEDDRLREKKISWLSKHDKNCGGLFGMLPLVQGMPIFLTNHLDRSSKALLRGRGGILLDWELHDNEPDIPPSQDHFLTYLPKCIYVQFYDEVDGKDVPANWSIAKMQPGVYCVSVKPEDWYLDARANYSHMRIKRYQLPVAPDFARTAYSMQGFTLPAGKIDLNLSKNADPATLYVAMSRFKKADDVLILQPFSIEVFQQGVPDQPRLLLKCIGQSRSVVTRIMKEHEEDISTKRAMKDRERQEKKKATMRENAVELNAKRVARAESDTCICKVCGAEKNGNQYSELQWNRNRRKETAVCLLNLSDKDCWLQGMRKA